MLKDGHFLDRTLCQMRSARFDRSSINRYPVVPIFEVVGVWHVVMAYGNFRCNQRRRLNNEKSDTQRVYTKKET